MADETEGGTPTGPQLDQIIEKFDTIIAKQKESLELRRQDAQAMGDIVELQKIEDELAAKLLQEKAQALDKELEALEAQKKANDELIANYEKLNAKEKKAAKQKLAAAKAFDKTYAATLEAKKEEIKLNAKDRAIAEEKVKTQSQANSFAGGIAAKLGLQAKFANTALGSFINMTQNLSEQRALSQAVANNLVAMLNPLNLAAGFVSKVLESIALLIVQTDAANKEFKKLTGFSGDFSDNMLNIADAGANAGISIADAGKAMGTFATNFSLFNPNRVNEDLVLNIARLEKIGVAGADAAKSMDLMVRAFNMSETAAADLTTDLALLGKELGITAGKMISDFNAVSGELVGFGDDMVNVFTDLQRQAKATGMEISSLVGIAKKFDTFSDAANAVGSLNAVLGTNLGTIEMVNASFDDRLHMLREEINTATGGGFNTLDRYTQSYIAQAMGVKDVAEAQRLLNMSQSEYLDYNKKVAERAQTEEELRKLSEEMVPITQQFQIAVTKLGIAFKPLISGIVSLLNNAVIPLMNIFLNKVVITLFTTMAGAILFLRTAIFLSSLTMDKFTLAVMKAIAKLLGLQAAEATTSSITYALAAANQALAGSYTLMLGTIALVVAIFSLIVTAGNPVIALFAALTAGMIAYAIASKFAAGRIGIIIGLFSALAAALAVRINPVFVAAFAFMAVGIRMMGKAFDSVGPKGILFALALALLAASVALVVYGVSALIDSITGFFQMLIDNIEVLPQLVMQMYPLALAFVLLGAGILAGSYMIGMAAIPLMLGAVGLLALYGALSLIGEKLDFNALMASMAGLGDSFLKIINTLMAGGPLSIFGIAAGIIAFAGAILILGGTGAYAAGGIALLGMALTPLAKAISEIGDGFESIGNGASLLASSLGAISALKADDEFFAVSTEGGKTSMVSAKGGILKNLTSESLTVDVKIPKIEVPQPIVNVYIDGSKVSAKIVNEVKKNFGKTMGGG